MEPLIHFGEYYFMFVELCIELWTARPYYSINYPLFIGSITLLNNMMGNFKVQRNDGSSQMSVGSNRAPFKAFITTFMFIWFILGKNLTTNLSDCRNHNFVVTCSFFDAEKHTVDNLHVNFLLQNWIEGTKLFYSELFQIFWSAGSNFKKILKLSE